MPGLIANANRVNDFVVKFANVNGTGSVEHSGPADLV